MTLRMVEVVIPSGRDGAWRKINEELDLVGAWRQELEGEQQLLRILVRSEKTETLLQKLSIHFEGDDRFRVMIFDVEGVHPRVEEHEPEEDSEEPEQENQKPKEDPQRVACAELVHKLSALAVINRVYVATVFLSTVVAAVGLMRDNVAVIIGAMVIAPLLGPNMTLALATTLGDLKLGKKAVSVNVVGLGLALAVSIVTGVILNLDVIPVEIQSRTSVGLSDVVLALAAGSAGALAFTTGISATVVGVMVAVALLPPLAAGGLLLGGGEWAAAGGALLLTLTNVICINLAAVLTFLLQNVQPTHWWEAKKAKRVTQRAAGFWIALLLLLVAIIFLHRF